MRAIESRQLNTPMFYGDSKDGVPAHSVVMTDAYMASLQHKGVQVANYMEKANAVSAFNQLRTVFYNLAYAQNTQWEKNKYIDLAKKMYKMSVQAEHELKVTGTPEYLLFQLSPDYAKFQKNEIKESKNYSRNTNWTSSYSKNRDSVINESKAQREAKQKELQRKLDSLSPQETNFMMNVMKTNSEHRSKTINQMMQDLWEQKQGVPEEKWYLQTLFNK